MPERQWDDDAQKAMDRMRRASHRGTGCHLTADMIASLELTFMAEIWENENPRVTPTVGQAPG